MPDQAETWRDWIRPEDDPAVVTRTELLDTVRGDGINERTLRYWEAAGALPRPVRKSHNGTVQALYPERYEILLREIQRRRNLHGGSKVPLHQLRPHLRTLFLAFVVPVYPVFTEWSTIEQPQMPEELWAQLHAWLYHLAADERWSINDARLFLHRADGSEAGSYGWLLPGSLTTDKIDDKSSANVVCK
ncbi:MAG: hypothetical protein ACR2QA_02980 [Solirubrobacteraceae bacterium]